MDPNTPQPSQPQPIPSTPPPASPLPPAAPPSVPPAVYEEEEEGGMKGKLLSIIIGAVVLVLVLLLVFFVIIPKFFPSKPGNATLVYWGLWEDPSVMNQIIADFNRQYPDIHVQYERQDIKSLGKYIDRLTTRINNGTGPDIFRYHNSWPVELRGYLLAFPSDVVNSLQLDTAYYNVVKRDVKINGAYYGVPLDMDTLAMYYNTDLFKAADIASPPTTWDALPDIAANLTVADEAGNIKTSGVALGTFDNIYHASDIISLLFVQNGADLYNLSGPTKQNAIDALGTYYTFFAKGNDNGQGKTWDQNMENSKLAFTHGNLAMYFGYSWDMFDIKARNPDLNFKVVPVPHLASDRNQSIASYWVEGVSAKTKHAKEAFTFLKYLGQKSTMEKLYALETKTRLFGDPYPRRDMRSLLASNPLLPVFLDQADNAVSTPFSSDTYDDAMNSALNTYLGNAVNSILNGSASPQSAVETLGAGENTVLTKYNIPNR